MNELVLQVVQNLQQDQLAAVPIPYNASRADWLHVQAHRLSNERLGLPVLASHEVLDLQIDAGTWAVKLTPPGERNLLLKMIVLADMVLERYQVSTDREHQTDLHTVTEIINEIDAAIVISYKYFPAFLDIFARTHICRFDTNNQSSELDKAITKLDEFQSAVNSDAQLLRHLAISLLKRFEKAGSRGDLEEGIAKLEQILAMDTDVQDKCYALANLAQFYGYLYELQPVNGDRYLDLAIEHGLEAVRLAPEGTPSVTLAFICGSIAKAFYDRHRVQPRPNDLETAIAFGKQAKHLSENGDPYRIKWINNLGLAYELQFEASGEVAELREAVELFQNAVDLSPGNTLSALRSTNNLANALSRRFEWTGETEALDLAISKIRTVVDGITQSELERANCLRTMGFVLFQRYTRLSRREDIDEAVARLLEAVKIFPDAHADVPAIYSLLCIILARRYEIGESEDSDNNDKDIGDAIDYGEISVSKRELHDIHSSFFFANLSRAYRLKWRKTQVGEDIKAAVDHSDTCLSLIPEDSPEEAYQHFNHASLLTAYLFAQNTTFSRERFDEPLRHFTKAAELSKGVPLVRVTAARNAIRINSAYGEWHVAKLLGLAAMELLPLVCGRYLAVQDQLQAISQTSGLAADVCSLLLQIGEPEEAVQQLEAGRAILLGYVMDDHDDMTALKADQPQLAQDFEELKSKLRLPYDLERSRLGDIKMRERREAEIDIERCLRAIRGKGHGTFLRGPTLDDIKASSKEGPIAIVNVTCYRSDAILIVDSKIHVVPLPNLQLEKVAEFSSGSYLKDSPLDRNAKMKSRRAPKQLSTELFVEWLWDSCVKIVFEKLKDCSVIVENGERPRIWWISSGAATGLPFHIATSGKDAMQDALSVMIPSYSPSIKALLHSRRQSCKSRSHSGNKNLAIVTMQTTPEHDRLDGVPKEKEAITNACNGAYECTELPQPSVDAVLRAMVESDIVHFACHGMANSEDPSQSHLLLEKVTHDDKSIDKLTVSKMFSLQSVRRPWIGYLSACSTAGMGAPTLMDEGLHMSSALQIAGFAHVVGSLWPVDDEVCADVARSFYEHLIQAHGGPEQDKAVAASLREAVLEIRQRDPLSWRKWGAYIHSGA